MRKQIWEIGHRYMRPSYSILRKASQNTIKNEEQLLDELSKGGKVTLSAPISLSTAAVITGVSSVNLNNQTITGGLFAESGGNMNEGNSDSYAFWVKDGDLTIEGNGEVIAQEATYSMAIWANGGNVTIKGGTFRNGGDGTDLIYASNGGSVYIYGGEFIGAENTGAEPGTANKFSLLNVKDSDYKSGASEIVVYGGKFHGFDPADNVSEGPNTNFVAEGYKSVEVETNVWEVVKA